MFSLGAILFEMFTGEIFTQQVYTNDFLNEILLIRSRTDAINLAGEKVQEYVKSVEVLARKVSLPDIFAFNDNVPKGIKHLLNNLFKELVSLNMRNRQMNLNSIYRQIDICILTLRHQKRFDERRQYKREIRRRQLERKLELRKIKRE